MRIIPQSMADSNSRYNSVSNDPDSNVIPPCHPGSVLREDFLVVAHVGNDIPGIVRRNGGRGDAQEQLEIKIAQIAAAIGVPVAQIHDFINEKTSLDAAFAHKLAGYFGTSENFWLNLQKHYDADMAQDLNRRQNENALNINSVRNSDRKTRFTSKFGFATSQSA